MYEWSCLHWKHIRGASLTVISSRSAYGKTISCDYGGAASLNWRCPQLEVRKVSLPRVEVEDGTGELDLTLPVRGRRPEAAAARVRASAIMSASLTTRRSFQAGLAAGLGVAEHIAGTAEFQVGSGDFGTVERVVNHFEPLLGGEPGSAREIKERPRVGAATPRAAQLMQLREAVSVGIKDDDAAGLLDVHADFDHRGGHQDRSLAAGKIGHDLGFDVVILAPRPVRVANRDALELWKFLQPVGDFGHRMQWRASHGFAIFVEGFVGVVDADGIGRRASHGRPQLCGHWNQMLRRVRGAEPAAAETPEPPSFSSSSASMRGHDIGPRPRRLARRCANHTPHGGGVGLIDHHPVRIGLRPPGNFGEPGNIEIAKPSHGGGARDRRGGHHQ